MTLTMSEERELYRDRFAERAVTFLADTFADDPFKVPVAVEAFAADLGVDPDELLHMPARAEARRAIKTVMGERPNGYPRYMSIGGAYQRTEAVPPEILHRLREQAQATAGGFLKRDQWLAELEAAQTGETVDDLVQAAGMPWLSWRLSWHKAS